jgi:hypothetical protein
MIAGSHPIRSSETGHDQSWFDGTSYDEGKRSMGYALKHFSIVDITHHADIESLTGKVKFQFQDGSRTTQCLQHYIVIDVAIAVTRQATLETIEEGLLEKASSILQSALAVVHHVENRALLAGRTAKRH